MSRQASVKNKLSFYLDAFHKTSQAPFLLMAGAKGLGKTEFAKAFAKNLANEEGDKRAFLELNCSTIKNNEQFFRHWRRHVQVAENENNIVQPSPY